MKKSICIVALFFGNLLLAQDFSKYNGIVEGVENGISLHTIRVSKNIYMIEGIGAGMGNIGVFESSEGFVMIDNSFEIIEDMITSAVKKIAEKPIKYIINTHYHYDHADGNRAYGKQGIPIIAHHNVRDRQKKIAKAYGGIYKVLDNLYVPKHEKNELPTITFKEQLSLHEGEEEISIFYFGKGHTDGDAIIKFEQSNVIHTGDSFVLYGLPYVDLSNGGSIKGFIQNLEKIASVCDKDTIIIPGHGALSNLEQLQKLTNELKEYYSRTLTGYKNGLSVSQIASTIQTDLGNTSGFGEPELVKHNFIKSILLENNLLVQ